MIFSFVPELKVCEFDPISKLQIPSFVADY